MKKLFIVFALFVIALQGGAKVLNVCEGLNLQVCIFDPTEDYEPLEKGPIVIPSVNLEDHTLYFATSCDGCTLRLVDANDNVVYSTVIPTGTTSLVLPSSLSGEYEIQIIQGNLCFYGYIYL